LHMEEKLEWFFVLVDLPNGESHIERVCGYSVWHAIDNLYTMKGFSQIQPDRSKYKQHKTKKKSYVKKTNNLRNRGTYLKNFSLLFQ